MCNISDDQIMIGSFADTSVWVGPSDLCNFVRFMRLETLWAAPPEPLALLRNETLVAWAGKMRRPLCPGLGLGIYFHEQDLNWCKMNRFQSKGWL